MNAITSIIPVPRSVPVERAGISVQVSELTLRDLAELQAMLDATKPDPLVLMGAALAGATGDRQRRLLQRAYHAADAGAAVYGEPSGRPYFATPEGVAALVWVACRRNHPDLTPAGAAQIATLMEPWEFSRLWRIAHGQTPRRAIELMLAPFPPAAAAQAGAPATWGQVIEEVIRDHPGWTNRDVYDLTLTEFSNARRGGKAAPEDFAPPAGMDSMEALAVLRAAFGQDMAGNPLPDLLEPEPEQDGGDDEGCPAEPFGQ